jgi:transcription termination factor NusB
MNHLLAVVVWFVLLAYPAVNALPAVPLKTLPSPYVRLIKKKQDRFLALNAVFQQKRQRVLGELQDIFDRAKESAADSASDARAKGLEEEICALTRKIEDNCLNYTVFLEKTLSRLASVRLNSSRRPFYRW